MSALPEVLVDTFDVAAETTSAELGWVTAEGVPQQVSLDEAEAVAFQHGLPVRGFLPARVSVI